MPIMAMTTKSSTRVNPEHLGLVKSDCFILVAFSRNQRTNLVKIAAQVTMLLWSLKFEFDVVLFITRNRYSKVALLGITQLSLKFVFGLKVLPF